MPAFPAATCHESKARADTPAAARASLSSSPSQARNKTAHVAAGDSRSVLEQGDHPWKDNAYL